MDYCLPCFGKYKSKASERQPLLPKGRSHDHSPNYSSAPTADVERPIVDKIVDVLAALNSGKLPSQDQISHFLQVLLNSELLKEDKGKIVHGNGPMSKQGRKVLGDVRALVQAALQFGMEKNADNKLQGLYFQEAQMNAPPIEVNVDKPTAYKAGQTALDATKQGASEFVNESPTKDQLAFDAETFVSALRTIFETIILSPFSRLILVDLISIARDQVAHAAADVGRAAHHVQQAADHVEQKARNTDDIIVATVSVDDVKDKGKEKIDEFKSTVHNVKKELDGVGEDVANKTKEKMLERIQEVISRIQKDPASRSAMRAILILACKYAGKIATASEVVSSTIEDTVTQTMNALNDGGTNYPPQPYGPQEEQKPFIDVTFDSLLQDFKIVLERVAKGHPLDSVFLAFSRVVRDLEDVPLIIGEETNKVIAEKTSQSTLGSDLKSSPTSPSLTSTPSMQAQPGKGKKKNKKARKRQKTLETNALPFPSPISASTSKQSQPEDPVTPSDTGLVEPSARGNPFRAYFSRVGVYLDKSLEVGWAMSKEGARALESLFDDGVELVNVGESVIDIGDESAEEKEERTPSTNGDLEGRKKLAATEYSKQHEEEMRRKFKNDLISLMSEIEVYTSALENDKTTMGLLRALDGLGVDLSELLHQGVKKGPRSLTSNILGMQQGWISWIGWAIPRLLRILPSGAVPIPSIEVKTENMEGALRALFVQGLADGKSYPVGTSLVPDEVVLKEWTEVRVDMVNHEPEQTLAGCAGPMSSSSSSSEQGPGVHTTSRVSMHMDGMRARVEGMGYYFKYKSCLVGYEDEGLLSVDVGMKGVHEGLGVDVEVEVESESAPFEAGETMKWSGDSAAASAHATTDFPEINIEDTDVDSDVEVETEVEVVDMDEPANLDIQAAVAPVDSAIGRERDVAVATTRNYAPAEPLFRVVDVSVAMRGLRFRIDKSRHWILNKLFVQPLAGPVVARLVKTALEEKVKNGLEVLAQGLGEVLRDARSRGQKRRTRAAARAMAETRGGPEVEMMVQEERMAEVLGDWWSAMLQTGPAVFGRAALAKHGSEDVQARTSVEATSKGVIFTNTTTTTAPIQEQPSGTPAMVYNPSTFSMERVDLTMEDIDGGKHTPQEVEEEEIVVAVGGAQLFPGKAGDVHDEANANVGDSEGSGLVQGVKENLKAAAGKAVNSIGRGAQEGMDVVERVEERWDDKTKMGSVKTGTWKSNAFDF